jgi:hypothetical protein
METSTKSLQRRYLAATLAAAAVCGLGLHLGGYTAAGRGFALGSLFSALNFILLGLSLNVKLTQHLRGPRRLFALSLGSILGRNLLLAVPIVMAIRLAQFDLPATIAGLFLVQICIMTDCALSSIRTRFRLSR